MSQPLHRPLILACAIIGLHAVLGCEAEQRTAEEPRAPDARLAAWPSISGLAELAQRRFIVVHDCKAGSGLPVIGVVTFGPTNDGASYAPVRIAFDAQPGINDLESIDAVPNHFNTTLMLESGGAGPRRAFLTEMKGEGSDSAAHLIGQPVDIRAVTPTLNDVESLAIETADLAARRFTVLVADRTPMGKADAVEVTVFRIALDFATGVATSQGVACTFKVSRPARLGPKSGDWRACTDLLLDRNGNLIGAAACDAGSRGPFASFIYEVVGATTPSAGKRVLNATLLTTIDGFKVEGLCRSSSSNSVWIGTDDEALGGAARPLAIPRLSK